MVQFIIFSIKVIIQGIQNFRGIYCGDFKPGVDLRVIINGDLNPLVQSVILFDIIYYLNVLKTVEQSKIQYGGKSYDVQMLRKSLEIS